MQQPTCSLLLQGKSTFRWAMVARNKARLEGVHAEMVKLNPKMKVCLYPLHCL